MPIRSPINCIYLIVLLTLSQHAASQELLEKKDSARIYQRLDTLAQRSKITKTFHDLLFKSKADEDRPEIRSGRDKSLSYKLYQGKTIRHIIIETLDPLGYSIEDTTAKEQSLLQKTGNKLHIQSKTKTIQNLLLIRENQPLDVYRIKESERLIRAKEYVRDVIIRVLTIPNAPDEVDIHIRVLDKWSILPDVSSNSLSLSDENLLGLGHTLNAGYNREKAYINTTYMVQNLGSTFVSGAVNLGIDRHGHLNRSVSLNRDFFSPLTKWAGGILISHQSRSDTVGIDPTPAHARQFVYNMQDFWGGSSLQIFKGNIMKLQSTKLITTARFLRVRYPLKPNNENELQDIFSSENFYLGSVGISSERFEQKKYIFKFGITEDVPVGKVLNITGGYQLKGHTERAYVGARLEFGNFNSLGYLSTHLEYGSFFRAGQSEKGVISVGMDYFTHLLNAGKWNFRQLVKPQLTIGINASITDSLTINEPFGLIGFQSPTLQGTRRLLLTLQTQSYAPFSLLGFRFGPYLTWTGGMLGDNKNGFKKSKLYSQFGLGILIRNEHMVLNTFQISLAFYPSIPGRGNNVLKLNSLGTSDFGFRNFEIGKPGPLIYQ